VAARRGDQKSDEKDRFQSHLVVWKGNLGRKFY
jgi:hypothetical protein